MSPEKHTTRPVVNIALVPKKASGQYDVTVTDANGKPIAPANKDEFFPLKKPGTVEFLQGITIMEWRSSPVRICVVIDNRAYCTLVDIDANGNVVGCQPC